jgi:hypothetical protein
MDPFAIGQAGNSKMSQFSANDAPWLLEDVPLAVRQRLLFQHKRTPASRGFACSGPIESPFLATRSNSYGFFHVRTSDGVFMESFSRLLKNLWQDFKQL